jgi:hypothetical protein
MLTKTESNVAEAKILAPSDGIVVYASSARSGGFRGSEEPMREGRTVFEREELIYLPTSNRVKAELKLHESVLDKVRMDMPATITVDALPGRVFNGRVKKIGLMPDAQMMWMNPDLKVYATEVYVDGDGSELRTGMSCRASIILEEYDNVIYAPVQSVVRIGNQPTVYVMEGSEAKPRPVQIGLDNNRMVHIKSGLEVGERILLAPPLAAAEAEQGRRRTNGEGQREGNVPPDVGGGDTGPSPAGPSAVPGGSGSERMGGEGMAPGGMPGGLPREGMQRPDGTGTGGMPGGQGQRPQGMQRSGQGRSGTGRPGGQRPEGMDPAQPGGQRPEGMESGGTPGGASGRMPRNGQQPGGEGSTTPASRPDGGQP